MGCYAGSMDVLMKVGGERDLGRTAVEVRRQVDDFVGKGYVEEAVKVWDSATKAADVSNLVTMTAEGPEAGRGFTLSVSNAGSFDEPGIKDAWFAAGQARTGAVNCVSAMTVNGRMTVTGHGIEGGGQVERRAVEILRTVGRGEELGDLEFVENFGRGPKTPAIIRDLPLAEAALAYGAYGVLGHLGAWTSFFSSLSEMSSNSSPEDFKAALNFWVFFAAAHPILQPVLGVSELMHGTPGPRVGGLVPVLFLLLSGWGAWAVASFSELAVSLNIFVFAAFINYIGSGLGGTNGMGDFNLALNDPYKGREFRGCPTYEQVRQPSMDGFDVRKYNGLWYEHAFHDWTQFKEVYDTTLDIKVDEDGKGWKVRHVG